MHFCCSAFLILLLVFTVCVCGQNSNPNGFINIDCGLPSNTSYVDSFTGLTYVSDDQYTNTGLNGKISTEYPVSRYYTDLVTLRSFPNGTKNCYSMAPVTKGSKYLVRATFYYGNYDNANNFPRFDLYFGVNYWHTVEITRADFWYAPEIIAIAPANYIQVCLVNTGLGTPFISALELRPLNDTLYEMANSTQSLNLRNRENVESNYTVVRYPDDEIDRIWYNYTQTTWQVISTGSNIDGSTFDVPSPVLQTAAISPTPNDSIDITWSSPDKSTAFYVVLHFAEIQIVQNTSLRQFYVYADGELVSQDPVPMNYLIPSFSSYTHTGLTRYSVSLKSSTRATLPPLLNAFELYNILPVTVLATDEGDITSLPFFIYVLHIAQYVNDFDILRNNYIFWSDIIRNCLEFISKRKYFFIVSAIESIKASYSIRKDWIGDPCLPENISWTGVSCKINSSNIPRITALNLYSSGLTGAIVSDFGYLTKLESLDLSHNNLTGEIPSSLDQLTSLTFLNLSENSGLSQTLPPRLQKRKNDGQLTVVFYSIPVGPEEHKKSSKAVIFVIVAVVILFLIVGGALFLLYQKNRKTPKNVPAFDEDPRTSGTASSFRVFDESEGPRESETGKNDFNFNKKRFSYGELRLITDDFSETIGTGGFGKVSKGRLNDGTEVAVKVRSESSSQGIQQFLNEVAILSTVHHRNLVSLIGYCKDGNHIALVYEYMQEGNLQDWLRGKYWSLSWKQRLRIVYESAQALEYLHKMCNPPLIHRDIKTSNILLTRNMEAKVSDFGLVRDCSDTHVSTAVMGTLGYLDPDYALSSQLTEKSDVYSFGVVLLEIITGKSPILNGQHLTEYVHKRLSKGNIESILEAQMGSRFNLNSIWRVAELALKCTGLTIMKPDMTAVVAELKESLNLEISSNESGRGASRDSSEYSGYSRNDSPVGGVIPRGNFEMAHIGGTVITGYRPLPR